MGDGKYPFNKDHIRTLGVLIRIIGAHFDPEIRYQLWILGSTTKIPTLSKGSTRKFKTRRSQSSFSSASDVAAENELTKGQPDLTVSEMK